MYTRRRLATLQPAVQYNNYLKNNDFSTHAARIAEFISDDVGPAYRHVDAMRKQNNFLKKHDFGTM